MRWRERTRASGGDHPARMASLEPREILGVGPEADKTEIKNAYRRLARAYHPDASDPFMKSHNEQVMVLLNRAYRRLLAGPEDE